MKRYIIFSLTIGLSLSLWAQMPKLNYKKINREAQREYLKPVRPGYEGRNPFWNGYSKRFLFAPAFDFLPIKGSQRYRYTLKQGDNTWTFFSDSPNGPLTPVWNKIPAGKTELTVEGLDSGGKSVGIAGQRSFKRDHPFHGPYAPPTRSYKECALKALWFIHTIPVILHWEKSDEPDMGYYLNTYPCKTIGGTIRCELLTAKFMPKQRSQAIQIARNCAKFLMRTSQPKGAPLAYFPPTYYGNKAASARETNRNKTMGMEAVKAAQGLLDLYDTTGDQQYFDHVLGILDTYKRIQGPDGSIPMKMDILTGEPVNNVCARLHPLLVMLRRMENQYKITDYSDMRRKGERWMDSVAVETFDMVGQFEDVSIEKKPYENLTHWTAVPYAAYLLEGKQPSQEDITTAKELIDFGEDQFTFWHWGMDDNFIHQYNSPGVIEQYAYAVPVDDSAANMAVAWLDYYKRTGNTVALAKAKALFDEITIMQCTNTGMIPTTWYGKHNRIEENNIWISCNYITIDALLRFSEFVGETYPD